MDLSSGAPRSEPAATMATAHLARFEFSDAGTKVLMVEWLPGAATAADAGAGADADAPGAGADAPGAAETTDATDATDAADAQPEAQAHAQVPSQAHSQDQSAVTPTPSGAVSSGSPSGSAPGVSSGPHGSGAANSASASGSVPVPVSPADAAAWEVSWPGKSTFLPARDADLDADLDPSSPASAETQRRRVFFLLPPDAPVPPTVTITPPGRTPIQVKPLPAIFPDGFGHAEASRPGSRGVLHTIWAKKRLRELEREMDAELRANPESVGLEMALAEKQWIVDSFLRPPPLNITTAVQTGPGPASPLTPRSPTGRLGEKLKGLRLATSAADLAPSPTGTPALLAAGSA